MIMLLTALSEGNIDSMNLLHNLGIMIISQANQSQYALFVSIACLANNFTNQTFVNKINVSGGMKKLRYVDSGIAA